MGWTLFFVGLLLLATVLGIIAAFRNHQSRTRYLAAADRSLVHVKWHEITKHLDEGGPTQYRQAIIDADNLVDFCLKQLVIPGATMGERLRNSGTKFSDYEGLWAAHKLRNQLVHEVDRELLAAEAKTQLKRFETALKDLGAV